MSVDLQRYLSRVQALRTVAMSGRLQAIHGLIVEAAPLDVHMGELMQIRAAKNSQVVHAEVVGLRENKIQLMPFQSTNGLCLGSEITATGRSLTVPVGRGLLGRVINSLGEPLDGLGELGNVEFRSNFTAPINPLDRTPIQRRLHTGVRAIDAFVPLGCGQRMGIFSGSGVGKSTLLGMMARDSDADAVVIALIGERGREVGDFLRDSLGENGLQRSVVVVASAEQSAVTRKQAAYTATCIAEKFREQGLKVLLIMDSITRFAMAQREIGLAIGEPIGARGYPASTFALLPPLLERAGALSDQGSITALYTVLVEGDDFNEPVSDHMRAVLDGHVVLDRAIAARGHFPAIDVTRSISRLANALLDAPRRKPVDFLRRAIANFESSRDLIELGAYEHGSNPELDAYLRLRPGIDKFLQQVPDESTPATVLWEQVQRLATELGTEARAKGVES